RLSVYSSRSSPLPELFLGNYTHPIGACQGNPFGCAAVQIRTSPFSSAYGKCDAVPASVRPPLPVPRRVHLRKRAVRILGYGSCSCRIHSHSHSAVPYTLPAVCPLRQTLPPVPPGTPSRSSPKCRDG